MFCSLAALKDPCYSFAVFMTITTALLFSAGANLGEGGRGGEGVLTFFDASEGGGV